MSIRALAIGVALAAASAPVMAQQRGTMEFGGFGSVAKFDKDLKLDQGVGGGGRVGMYIVPRLSVEFEESWMRSTRPLGLLDANVGIIAARLTGVAYSYNKLSVLVGGGAGVSTETNFLHADGVDGLAGLKYAVTDQVALRLDGVWDWLADDHWKTYKTVRLGVSIYRHP